MNKTSIALFLGTFAVGAVAALLARTALFDPHAGHAAHAAGGGDYAAMVSNPLAPAATKDVSSTGHEAGHAVGHGSGSAAAAGHDTGAGAAAASASTGHAAGHGTDHAAPAHPAKAKDAEASSAEKPVNTVCGICGMEVDPKVPTAQYKGKTIGFGCKVCLPKFKADPDRYGPYYLRNEVIKEP